MDLVFVLLSEAQLPSGLAVTRAFESFAPKSLVLRPAEGSPAGSTDGEILHLSMTPGGDAFIALIPMPIGTHENREASKFSLSGLGGQWQLPDYKAHLIVTLHSDKGDSPVDRLNRVTSLVAAVTQVAPAVGVYWGAGGATHEPGFFTSTAKDFDIASRIALWTGVSIAHEADGRVSLLSLGMKQLGVHDLLLTAPASASDEAINAFFNYLGYCAERGAAPKDGDTIGSTESERLRVRYMASPNEKSTTVWSVELP